MTTQELLIAASAARSAMATATTEQKNAALVAMAQALEAHTDDILAANAADAEAARGRISDSLLDRLLLSPARIRGMADGIREVAALPDPVGRVLRETTHPKGMSIRRVAVPMGVVAIIYESRPNVTSDAAALALKSGNVCVLRSGRDAWRSANAVV
ncbi:MAG: gamma-glutamyl-phosphate reductase, partial [Clostridia bacterium]|nr:gamma-glutamyl-phosphate reductase [Clostridia bacterium]